MGRARRAARLPRRAALLGALVLLGTAPCPAVLAQHAPPAVALVPRMRPSGSHPDVDAAKAADGPAGPAGVGVPAPGGTAGAPGDRWSWWALPASLVLPGSGQALLGQQRSVAYLALEAFAVVQWRAADRDGDRDRDRYRTIAAEVARAPFGDRHAVGPWEYYEAMEYFQESGVFSRGTGGPVEPEVDESTFNGAQWRLARETFWRDPEEAPPRGSEAFVRALAFYEARAVRDGFRWSWRDARLQQELYRQTIASANRRYQRAVNVLGVVGANHLLSLVDAYVTVRIRRDGGAGVAAGAPGPGLRLRVQPVGHQPDGPVAWGAVITLPWGPAGRRDGR